MLAATILILAELLRSRPTIHGKKNLFIVFLIFLILVGCIRMEGRWGAEKELEGRNASVYPTPDLFSWAALQEEGDSYLISSYDLVNGTASSGQAFPRLTAPSQIKEAEEALDAAEGLSPVKIFRWRAYAVAVNASLSGNGSWYIEYYDPLVRAQRDGSWSYLRPPFSRYGSLRVVVQGGIARMAG